MIRSSQTQQKPRPADAAGPCPLGCRGSLPVVEGLAEQAHLPVMDTQSNPWGLDQLLDIGELADYLGIPVTTVYDWRTRGLGPRAYRIGKHLKFAVTDVHDWMEQQREPDPTGRW